MSARKLAPHEMPAWPRALSRELAAAYVGLSVNQFDADVAAGVLPAAVRWPSCRRVMWDRLALDARFDALSGFAHPRPAAAGDVADEEWLRTLDEDRGEGR